MSEQLQTTTILTAAPTGRARILLPGDAKALPAEKVTRWEVTHSEPLVEHELAAARQVTAQGLIGTNGAVHAQGARIAKGTVYLQLLGKTVTKTAGTDKSVSFTPTPDEINRMPSAVIAEFAALIELGKLPDEAEAEEAKNE
jgi:hypothetical protein